jgi:hypothetical protein
VASVGGPGLHLAWGDELLVPKEVERCVHFVSGHEVRQAFPLDSVRNETFYLDNCEEVVYPGVHSDVGGGYFDGFQGRGNQLSRIALRHMYAEALESGAMLRAFQKLKQEDRAEWELPDDSPLIALYAAYMESLPKLGDTLENLIQAHRVVQFTWRGAITRAQQDTRVLGALYRQVDAAMCAAVEPARDDDREECVSERWEYELPDRPDEQARQLLAEHRRLVGQIPAIRDPVDENSGDTRLPRRRTGYEDLIIEAWDATKSRADVPKDIERFLAEHVHDSVAHFSSWPCALYDPRGIFCEQGKYFANARQPSDALAV